jgi:hypothetical protein
MSLFRLAQTAIKAILEADDLFADVPVIATIEGDAENKATQRIKKIGLCLLIMTPEAGFANPTDPGPYADPLKVVIQVWETRATNKVQYEGSPLHADDVIERASQLLHRAILDEERQLRVFNDPTGIQLQQDDAKVTMWDLELNGVGYMGGDPIPTTATPTIVYDEDGQVQMACDDPAVIFYTTDGSEPNTGSTPYEGIFESLTPATIKARAYRPGWLPSEVAEAEEGEIVPVVTFNDIREAFITKGGKTQFSEDGQILAIKEDGTTYHRILVSELDGVPGVVATNGEVEQP